MSIRTRPSPCPLWLLVAVVCTGMGAYLAPPDIIRVGAFSEASPSKHYPSEWEFIELANGHKQTEYNLVESERGVVMRAHSKGGLSTLLNAQRIDLQTHPILEWSWKVDEHAETANVQKRNRSDFTAAVTVDFEHELSVLHRLEHFLFRITGYHVSTNRALMYLWANQADRGSVMKHVQVDWHTMVIVRNGSSDIGRWVSERRNVLDDYRTIFGEEPPPVKGVSLVTETNDTGERATAYYGDLSFRPDADSLIGPSLRTDRRPD